MTIHGTITFDGVDISTFGNVDVVLGKPETTPAREFNVIQAAGRNGDIVLDNEKYANVNVSYWVMIRDNFEAVYQNIRGFLLSRTGYCRLSDSWHPNEFYQAYVNMPIEPKTYRNREGGSFQVTFSRKPQRFLVSGETDITSQFTTYNQMSGVDFRNAKLSPPYYFPARPVFSLRTKHVTRSDRTNPTFVYLASFYISTSQSAYHPSGDPLQAIILWTGKSSSASDINLHNTVILENDIIDIDCEARTVFNRTQGISLNDYTYITDSGYNAWAAVPGITKFYNDFPVIEPIIGTEYKVSSVYVRNHEVLSFYPRWWTI